MKKIEMDSIDMELEEIIKDSNGNDTWQNKAIKTLALCLLTTRQEIKKLHFKMNLIMWLLASVIILLVSYIIK